MKKKTKLEKENVELRKLLYHLSFSAERVLKKYGVNDDGTPKDWEEWVDLKVAINNTKGKGKCPGN
jgi:hypothetical protein